MADLAGQPLIWHILQRACGVPREFGTDLPVVLATTDHPRDDVLAEVAAGLDVAVIRGSEDDVLGRFLLALEQHPASWVIRICGDSPLFDPAFLARCLSAAQEEDADVVKFRDQAPSLFQGGEVISAKALQYTRDHAGDDPLATEHVTAWAMAHAEAMPDVFRTAHLDPQPGFMSSDFPVPFKLSIDTSDDLVKLRALYSDLYQPGELVDLRQAATWLSRQEEASS